MIGKLLAMKKISWDLQCFCQLWYRLYIDINAFVYDRSDIFFNEIMCHMGEGGVGCPSDALIRLINGLDGLLYQNWIKPVTWLFVRVRKMIRPIKLISIQNDMVRYACRYILWLTYLMLWLFFRKKDTTRHGNRLGVRFCVKKKITWHMNYLRLHNEI